MPVGRRSSAFADYVIGPAWLTSIVRHVSMFVFRGDFLTADFTDFADEFSDVFIRVICVIRG